jgi:predicted nucleic acid-binding protein
MIIVDTNLISEAARPAMDGNVRQWFASQPIDHLYTTTVSIAEIWFGIERLPAGRRQDLLRQSMQVIFDSHFLGRILPFDERAARAYGRLVASAEAQGRTILIADGQIAALAQVQGFAVATRDTAPFEAAGVPVVNPWNVRSTD